MLLTKEVKVKWNNATKKHYIKLGYEFTQIGDDFVVPIKHLHSGSTIKVRIQCDYCEDIFDREYRLYLKSHDEEFGDTCKKCSAIKGKRTKLERYGNENYNNREQMIRTNLKRYGVEWYPKATNFVEQVKQTKLERYGDENYHNTEQMKQTKLERYGNENYNNIEQNRLTCLKRYGVRCTFQLKEVRHKAKQTCLERYGDENYNNVEQTLETKHKNGTLNNFVTFSKPHQYTYGLLCGFYGNESVELEKPLGRYSLDCELIIDGIKVDVEYNGKHWHDFEKDKARQDFIMSQGYRILNINSYYAFPTFEQIEKSVNTLTTTNTQIITIDLDTK